MPDRNQSTFLPPARCNSLVLRGQVGVLRFRRDMGNFDEHLPEPAAPFACLATEPLASTFIVSRTHPRPRGEMLGAGKTAHIGPDLRDADLGRALTNPGNRVEEGDGFLVRYQTLVNFPTDARNGVLSGIMWQKLPGYG